MICPNCGEDGYHPEVVIVLLDIKVGKNDSGYDEVRGLGFCEACNCTQESE